MWTSDLNLDRGRYQEISNLHTTLTHQFLHFLHLLLEYQFKPGVHS